MLQRKWRILLVDDEQGLAQRVRRILEKHPVDSMGNMAEVVIANDFASGLRLLDSSIYDLLILDIRDDSASEHETHEAAGDESTEQDTGLELYERSRATRFVPIVFYSAIATMVADLAQPPFVSVVSKLDADDDALQKAVVEAFDSQLPLINRALHEHVLDGIKTFMREFVEIYWAQLQDPERKLDIAHVLARRLSRSLSDGSALEESLRTQTAVDAPVQMKGSHPMRMYVFPALGDLAAGDIVVGQPALQSLMPSEEAHSKPTTGGSEVEMDGGEVTDGGSEDLLSTLSTSEHPQAEEDNSGVDHWIVLSPTCDMVDGRVKANRVVLARALLLDYTNEVIEWKRSGSNGRKVERLLSNTRVGDNIQADRYYALPAAGGLPGLLIDYQGVISIPHDELKTFKRLATVDDPYAQDLIARFGRYFGRVGVPVIDADMVKERLRQL